MVDEEIDIDEEEERINKKTTRKKSSRRQKVDEEEDEDMSDFIPYSSRRDRTKVINEELEFLSRMTNKLRGEEDI